MKRNIVGELILFQQLSVITAPSNVVGGGVRQFDVFMTAVSVSELSPPQSVAATL